MGSTRLAEAEGAVVHLQWHIRHFITHGKYFYIPSLVDGSHYSQARSVIGPDVITMSPGYACTECLIGGPLNPGDPDTFVVGTKDVVEYLDVEDNEAHDNIRQAVRLLRSGLDALN